MSNYYNRQWRLPNAWNGTESNVNKQSNYSLEFDGTNYIDLSTNLDTYYKYVTTVSFSVWVNFKDLSTDVTVLGTWRTASHMLDIRFLQSTGKLSFRVGFGADTAGEVEVISSGKIVANTWYHLAMVYDGSGSTNADKLKGYINGSPETLTFTGTIPSTTSNILNRRFDIGGNYTNKDGNKLLDGVAIFNYPLTSSQVTTLYGSSSTGIGNPMSLSPKPVAYYPLGDQDAFNGANYLVPNIAAEEADGDIATSYSPYALDFDGTSSYLDLGSTTFIDTSSAFTISGWYKSDGLGTSDFDNTFAFKTNSTASFIGYYNNYTSGGGYNPFCFGLAGNSTFKMDGGTIPSGWFHLCLVYDGNGIANTTSYTLYINNQSQSLTTAGGLSGPSNINHIGEYNSGNYFNGQISNVSIWNAALTSSQVTEIYSEGVPSNLNNHSAYTNLVSWWQLGSNSSYTNKWICLDEKGTNNGESVNKTESSIVDGVNTYANGLSSGMGGDEIVGDAPYSSSNSLSINMDIESRTTDTPS